MEKSKLDNELDLEKVVGGAQDPNDYIDMPEPPRCVCNCNQYLNYDKSEAGWNYFNCPDCGWVYAKSSCHSRGGVYRWLCYPKK